jgi:lantibiotic modifying enzyme
MGKEGLLSILAISRKSEPTLRSLLDSIPVNFREFELLYGAAGSLYILGFILKHWPEVPYSDEIIQKIRAISKNIVESSERPDILLHKFPSGSRGKYYLGAAHGIMGILHIMLQLRNYIPEYDSLMQATVDFIASQQFVSGNFPVILNSKNDDTLHFCHGSPGAIPLLCLAYKAYGFQGYLDCALRAGEDLWNRGLLRKGRSLCHGVSGNGYSFLHLYNTTGDVKWLHRAQMFAIIMGYDEDYDKSTKTYDDGQRMKIGEPDHPYSLMEGISGAICFLKDCLEPSTASFPGYDF